MRRVHGLHRADASAVAERQLCDLAALPEMPIDTVLYDRDTEHLRGRGAVDVSAVPECVKAPLLAAEPRNDAGLNRGEVRHDEMTALRGDKRCPHELAENLSRFSVHKLEGLKIPIRDGLPRKIEVRDVILREVLELDDPPSPPSRPVCPVELEHSANSPVSAHGVEHGLIFFRAAFSERLPELEHSPHFRRVDVIVSGL